MHSRVEHPRRPNDLLRHRPLTPSQLQVTRRGAHKQAGLHLRPELEIAQWAIVHRRRQAEAIVDESFLARPVSGIHRADLRHGHVALVHNEQPVRGKVVQQRVRGAPGISSGEVTAVVFNAGAVAHGAEHFQVVVDFLAQPCGFNGLAHFLERFHLLVRFFGNLGESRLELLFWCDEMLRRINAHPLLFRPHHARHAVENHNAFDSITEEIDAINHRVVPRYADVQNVATEPKCAARNLYVVPSVLEAHELVQDVPHVTPDLANIQRDRGAQIFLWKAKTVDARNRRDDHDVVPLVQ
mmetsp:Transcript_13930/g.35557  ORF Transcript_13930/g.35557 Transcript_13930/m.35557 type:complete len:297 (-) Transcript_13930:608-1498(-)